MNQFFVIGRLVKDPELRKTESGKNVTNVTLAVPRAYKNPNGEYDTDFINCILWKGVAESTATYCKKGDLVGVRGRIQTRNYEHNSEKRQAVEVVAEKVSFPLCFSYISQLFRSIAFSRFPYFHFGF